IRPGLRREERSILRFLPAVTFDSKLHVRDAQIRIDSAALQPQRVIVAARARVKLLHAPGEQTLLDLFRKSLGVSGRGHGLWREYPRGLMLAVAVARGSAPARCHNVRTKSANYAHHIVKRDVVSAPFLKGFVGALGEAEVGDAAEALFNAVITV